MSRIAHNKGQRDGGRPAAERFWEKVDRSGGADACWPWTGTILKMGYGNFTRRSYETILTHRFAWVLENGREIPVGMVVLHSCDNRPCCNPAHLSIGTHADNVADMVSRGRQGAKRKLTPEQVTEIRRELAAGSQQKAVAVRFGVTDNAIRKIKLRETWKALA